MPFVPHTQSDINTMLAAIGISDMAELFAEIPTDIRYQSDLLPIPDGMNELTATRYFQVQAKQNTHAMNFIGAGAYEHHIPAAVWELTSRGEFMTAYTPYQAEASQGSLQLIYEFQSMMTGLTAMDVANASLYDGATALAEAVLMAVRSQRKVKTKRILVPGTLNPTYFAVVDAIVRQQQIELVNIPMDQHSGLIDMAALEQLGQTAFNALVIPMPNFFGGLEAVDQLTDWAHQHQSLTIAVVNPMALGLLKPPGQWGSADGVDIVCGELQPFGIPLASGGPYAGFMCCRKALVRQMPGRIVGRTHDSEGNEGYVLTLQAREQHIRRSKATSNICTNQGLLVTAATIYMSLMGPQGIYQTALSSHQNLCQLIDAITAANTGIQCYFSKQANFHEVVLALPCPVKPVIDRLAEQGIIAGYDLSMAYPELGQHLLLVCVTETKTHADIQHYCQLLLDAVQQIQQENL